MQAAIAKRLATIAVELAEKRQKLKAAAVPTFGALLMRAGKVGATAKTLAMATGYTESQAQDVLNALEAGGFAHQWTGDVWRLDTVQILAREERAAIEALERASKEQDAAQVAAGKENAPAAQTIPAVCIECWRRDRCKEPRKPCAEGKATEREQRAKKGGKNGGR